MTKIAIIYDASYLMRAPPRALLHDHPLLMAYDIDNIIAEPTIGEVAGKLKAKDEPTRKNASHGRIMISNLTTAQTARTTYRTETLVGIEPYETGDPLGADSPVDKLILGAGKTLAEAGGHDAVLIASGDNGIWRDALTLRSSTRLPVFCVRGPGAFDKSFDVLWHHLAFGSSSGHWRPDCVCDAPPEGRQPMFRPSVGADEVLASIDRDGRTIRLWRFAGGTLELIDSIKTNGVTRCELSPGGGMFVVGGGPTTTLWYPPTAVGAIAHEPVFQFAGDRFHLSPDGRFLADFVGVGWRVTDLGRRETVRREGPSRGAYSNRAVAFSGDSQLVAVGGSASYNPTGGFVDIWNLLSGEYVRLAGASGMQDIITALAFSPRGNLLAAGSNRGEIHLWRLPSAERLPSPRLPPPEKRATAEIGLLAFSPDEGALACGASGFVGLLHAPSFDRIMPVDARRFPRRSAKSTTTPLRLWFDPQGARLVSVWGSAAGSLAGPTDGVVVWSDQGEHLLTFNHGPGWFDADREGEFAVTGDFRIWRLCGPSDRVRLLPG